MADGEPFLGLELGRWHDANLRVGVGTRLVDRSRSMSFLRVGTRRIA